MSEKVMIDFSSFRPTIPVRLSPHPLFDNFGHDPGKEASAAYLGLNSDNSYILFFGFIRAYKGLDLLLEAFASSHTRSDGKARLIVAGEFYENDEPYMKIIEERQLRDDVVLIKRFINDDEVKYLFGVADLVVQPYRNATQSGVTQIAYHFSKPMIVTDVGGLRESVPDGRCGFVVKADSADIAKAIDRFYTGEFTAAFTEGIREEKARYGWDRMTSAVKDLYKNITKDDNKK